MKWLTLPKLVSLQPFGSLASVSPDCCIYPPCFLSRQTRIVLRCKPEDDSSKSIAVLTLFLCVYLSYGIQNREKARREETCRLPVGGAVTFWPDEQQTEGVDKITATPDNRMWFTLSPRTTKLPLWSFSCSIFDTAEQCNSVSIQCNNTTNCGLKTYSLQWSFSPEIFLYCVYSS